MNIVPAPSGTGGQDYSVSIPTYSVEALKKEFPSDLILIGPGNQVGLLSAGSGLIKDGIIENYQLPTLKVVYLMKRD
jgi:hypothetical protein